MFERHPYEKWAAYGQAKTANILHAVELDRRLASRGIRAFAVHPGVIMTDLGRHLTQADIEAFTANSDAPMQFKTVEAGAATTVYTATAPELDGRGGLYLEDCGVAAVDDASADGGVRSYALDPATAEQLWTLSEELVGQSFDL
jgi:NAD(P)-dependent dehydrogenase (short-subunit alcohol dehydrogenase family)